MHLIIYISDYTGTSKTLEEDIRNICHVSKNGNIKFAISGVLFYHNNNFLQVIEGDKEDLENLMKNIEKDNRHKNFIKIIDDSISQRCFEDWSMDSFNLNNRQYIDENIVRYLKDSSYEVLPEIDSKVFIELLKDFLLNQ